ncbi:MAG: hypothetical protein D6681_09430, partial [Calditrichaeota bacterium]
AVLLHRLGERLVVLDQAAEFLAVLRRLPGEPGFGVGAGVGGTPVEPGLEEAVGGRGKIRRHGDKDRAGQASWGVARMEKRIFQKWPRAT